MIKKWYECTCDYCGNVIVHLPYKPDASDIQEYGGIMYGKKMFCDDSCYQNYKHDLIVSRVGNLKQFAPGKRFERK